MLAVGWFQAYAFFFFFFSFKGNVDCVNVGGKTIEKNLTQLY